MSARHEADPDARSRTHALLGWVLHMDGRDAEALVHLEQAPTLAAQAGDVISEAIALLNLAVVLDSTGDHQRAGELLDQARALAVDAHHPPTEMLALQHLADHCLATGAYGLAAEHAVRALGLGTSPRRRRAASCCAPRTVRRSPHWTAPTRPGRSSKRPRGRPARWDSWTERHWPRNG